MIIGKKKENISEQTKITNFSHFLHIYRCTSLYPGISLFIVWFETKLFNFYLRCDIFPAENINISKLFQQYLCKSIRRPMQAPHNIRHPLWKYLFVRYNLSALNKILTNSDFRFWHKMSSKVNMKISHKLSSVPVYFLTSYFLCSVLLSKEYLIMLGSLWQKLYYV